MSGTRWGTPIDPAALTQARPGDGWEVACDGYGKVRHSKKACVYTVTRAPGEGERIVTVAARIPNWTDARVMAKAPEMRAWIVAMLDSATEEERCDSCGSCLYCEGRTLLEAM